MSDWFAFFLDIIDLSGKQPDSSRGGLMKLKLSSQALSDHESRLYCSNESTDTVKVHIDQSTSIYTIIKATKIVTTVEMSESAIKEYLSDGDYQAEFNSEDKNPFGLMWARATKSVRKQIKK